MTQTASICVAFSFSQRSVLTLVFLCVAFLQSAAERGTCESHQQPRAAALMQMHASFSNPSSHAKHAGHESAGNKHHQTRTGHVGGAPPKQHVSPHDLEAAKQQMRSAQDGISAFKAASKSIREMNLFQRDMMQLVAWLLIGNIIVIVFVCMWQIFVHHYRVPASKDPANKASEEPQNIIDHITTPEQLAALSPQLLGSSKPGQLTTVQFASSILSGLLSSALAPVSPIAGSLDDGSGNAPSPASKARKSPASKSQIDNDQHIGHGHASAQPPCADEKQGRSFSLLHQFQAQGT